MAPPYYAQLQQYCAQIEITKGRNISFDFVHLNKITLAKSVKIEMKVDNN